MKTLRRDQGSALTAVVIMMVIVMTLTVAYSTMSVTVSDVNLRREFRYQARVAAMSGLQRAIIELDASVSGVCSHTPTGVTRCCFGNLDGNISNTRVTSAAGSPTAQKTWNATPITMTANLMPDNFSMASSASASPGAEQDGWVDFRDQTAAKPWVALSKNAPDGTYTVRAKPEGDNDALGRKQAYRMRVYAAWKGEIVGYEAIVRKTVIRPFKFAAFGDLQLAGNGSIQTDSWKSGFPEDSGTVFTGTMDYQTANLATGGTFPVNSNGDVGSNGSVSLSGGSNSINGQQIANAGQTIPEIVFPAEPTSQSFTLVSNAVTQTVTTLPKDLGIPKTYEIGAETDRLADGTAIVLGDVDYGNNTMVVYPAANSEVHIFVRGPNFKMGNGVDAGLKIDQPILGPLDKPGVVKFYLEPTVTEIRVDGQGVLNTDPGSVPFSCQFISKSAATFHFGGSSTQNCLIMAPSSQVDLAGGVDFYGAIVSSTVSLSGNATFHFDESLANSELKEAFPIYRIFSLVEVPQRD